MNLIDDNEVLESLDGMRFKGTGRCKHEKAPGIEMTELVLTSVLRKTEAGVNAIKLRDRALSQKHRMLLILVDGGKTTAALSGTLPNPDEARQVLGELWRSGYIEVVKSPAPASAPATDEAKTVSARSEEALPELIRRATRLLENLLGPTCEPLCLQLEKCKSIDQFTVRILDLRRIVASMRSETKADEFVVAALKT